MKDLWELLETMKECKILKKWWLELAILYASQSSVKIFSYTSVFVSFFSFRCKFLDVLIIIV